MIKDVFPPEKFEYQELEELRAKDEDGEDDPNFEKEVSLDSSTNSISYLRFSWNCFVSIN